MKKNQFKFNLGVSIFGLAFMLMSSLLLSGCKEDISTEAYATKTEPTLIDKIDEKSDELSSIRKLLDEVKLGNKSNSSSMTSVLSARGNYTVFAPNDEAVKQCVIELTGDETGNIESLSYEQKQLIVLNCIIDNGDASAYESVEFPTSNQTFALSNLNNRRLKCMQDAESHDYFINGDATSGSRVVETDYECTNGMLHVVSKVILPSTKSVSELISVADNMHIFGKLLRETGLYDELALHRTDEIAYEEEHSAYAGSKVYESTTNNNYDYQATRNVAFTAFVEPDEVFYNDWGVELPNVAEDGTITNWDAIKAVIVQKCTAIFGNQAADDLKNPKNAVYQFMAYHLLNCGLAIDELVRHFDEYGYLYGNDMKKPNTFGYSVNVWDYYTTMGSPAGLMKITQLPTEEYYINRISVYDNAIVGGTYVEDPSTPVNTKYLNKPGQNGLNIQIQIDNGVNDNNAANGFYFPIDHMLIYSDDTRAGLASERMRMDIVTMLPEIQSNDLRGAGLFYFPKGYFSNISGETTGTTILYLQNGYASMSGAWKDYKGDEILVTGRYDFVLKLPPVPQDGTYEIRMGASLNTLRGMFQIYFGDSPTNTQPVGLPIDQRESVSMIPGQPWVADDDLNNDPESMREADRNLKNVGYMKATQYMMVNGTESMETCRNASPGTPALRRIITTANMKKDKSYYLRFKLAIENAKTQFMLDYFEIVPISIVNGTTPEDIW